MLAHKAAQLADQIRDFIAEWAQQDMPGLLFSISQVTLSPDLHSATVWVEVLNPPQEESILRSLKRNQSHYQHRLYQSLHRRSIPTISFKASRQAEIEERFQQLLKQ